MKNSCMLGTDHSHDLKLENRGDLCKFVFSMIGVVLAATLQLNSLAVAAEREAMPVAPTVIYGDDILVESGAIIDIILNRHAPVRRNRCLTALVRHCKSQAGITGKGRSAESSPLFRQRL